MSCRKEASLRGQLTTEGDEVRRLARRLARVRPGDPRGTALAEQVRHAKANMAGYEDQLETHRGECPDCTAPV